MKYRVVLLLSLLVLLPLLLLGGLGYRLQQNEQQLVGLQLQKLIEQQLESIDDQLQSHFRQLDSLLRREAGELYRLTGSDYAADELRRFIKHSPQVQQLFVLGPDDRRRFPPPNQPLSLDEQRLVERLQPLWQSPDLLRPPAADPAAPAPSQSLLSTAKAFGVASADRFVSGQLAQRAPQALPSTLEEPDAESDLFGRSTASKSATAPHAKDRMDAQQVRPEQTASGWIAWHVDARLMHIYWWRDPVGRTLGFVLNDARLLSDLINRLPDAGQGNAALGEAQIRLLDSQGNTLYSWGGYQGQDAPLRSLGLSHPLGSWSLAYHAPALKNTAAPIWLTLVAPLLLLGAGLAVLGYLLYREHRRELQLAQQRVNFVNQVSHELKTPLTNVRLYVEMLQQQLEDDTEPAVGRYLGVISDESRRLSRLIENVLSFSRLQRQQPKPAAQLADPDEQIGRILETFAPLLRQRGIEPGFAAGIGQPLQYDPAILEQILNNLLSNCEKYAPDSGGLQLRSWLDGAQMCIAVQDQGPGIAINEHAAIFDPFYRCSNRLTDGITGTGIGLGLARDLARAHGGDLILAASDTGACFEIRLETGV